MKTLALKIGFLTFMLPIVVLGERSQREEGGKECGTVKTINGPVTKTCPKGQWCKPNPFIADVFGTCTNEKCATPNCKIWIDECSNTCLCPPPIPLRGRLLQSPNGPICTKKACKDASSITPYCKEEYPLPCNQEGGKICPEDEVCYEYNTVPVKEGKCSPLVTECGKCKVFFDGCNHCSCGEDGQVSQCTKRACSVYQEPKCLDDEIPPAGTCPLDCTTWNDGCNTCSCVDGKVEKCTEMACLIQGEPFCVEKKDQEDCPLDCTTWNDGCNTCSCVDGRVENCTKKKCLIQGEPFCVENKSDSDGEDEESVEDTCDDEKNPCPELSGLWCKDGSCTNELCPNGCKIWSDGCNSWRCVPRNGDKSRMIGPQKQCLVAGTPKCLKSF